MSRILEAVFVMGCSLVGLAMNAREGSEVRNAMQCSIQFIALAHDNMAGNVARLSHGLARVPIEVLGSLRTE